MKSYYKLIVLILIGYSSITGARAQLKAGTEGLYIKAGTALSTDGLILTPFADLSLSDLTIEKSATPVSGNAGSGINRAYNFSAPVTFSGTLGFYYLAGELNGNTEGLLQLVYKSSAAATSYTATTGSSVNITTKYIENTFASTALSTLSAADPAIFIQSANANLSAIALSSGTLSPTFATGTESYTASVVNSVSSLTVTPTSEEANTTITVNGTTVSSGSASGAISLNVGSNTLTIGVTAQDGTTKKTYTTTVFRDLASQTIVFNALPSKTYGDSNFTLPDTASSGLNINYVSDNTSVATISGNIVTIKNAGVAKITASQAGNSNYKAADPIEQSLVINKMAITLTSAAQTKTYGDSDPTLTYSITTGTLVGSDSFTGILARDAGENVGSYLIKQGTLTLGGNYDLIYAGSNLEINKKAISITAASKSKIYGEADPALTYTVTTGAIVGSDSFTGTLSRDAGENVGSYPIKQGTLALSTNYALTYAGANLEIGKQVITIAAASKSKIYGEADPALTYSITAGSLVGSDTFTGSLTRDAGENAGNYLIKQGSLTLGDNYALTYSGANLEIGKKSISIAGSSKSKTYGETDPALTYSITAGSLVGSDTFIGLLARDAGENAGNYLIKQGTLALSTNYALTYTGANLEIGKKAITITATSKSKIYGEADPALTYTVTTGALVGSDTFTGILSRDAGSNAGIYSINSGTLALNSNYNLSYIGAKLTIGIKDLAIIVDNKSKIYGDVNPPLTATYIGLVNGDTGLNLSTVLTTPATTGSAVGTYDIEPNATSANYSITFSKGTLTVSKKLLTVTADNKTKLQNSVNPILTVNYNGFIAGENQNNLSTQPTASTTATTLSAEGSYPITVSGGVSNNYSYAYLPGTLTITPGVPTNIDLAAETIYENAPTGTIAGALSSTSGDATATFTYRLVDGNGSTDNTLFTITGNQIKTASSFNFEQKASYAIRVRTTTQQNLFFEKAFIISINNVNEQPALDNIANQVICYSNASQAISISGITAGPDASQSTTVTVSTTNNALFESLEVTQADASGNAVVNYKISNGSFGSAVVNVMVMDDGGTANSGINTILKSFIIQVNSLPQVTISSDKGLTLSKGETALLAAVGGATYQWKNSQGILSGQNTAVLTIRPEETTTYKVTATNISGCVTEQEITITVNADFELVSGTNIMSPNGDGVNDNLIIKNIDMYPKNEVKIFDRAGRLLYSQKNYTDQWNGTLNGSPLAEDTYFYIVDFGPGLPQKRGFISIVKD